MRPDIRYGLIGAIVFTLILVTGEYIIEKTARTNTILVYLRELVLIVSVIASIKATRDLNKADTLELRTGLKAGIMSVLIICAFILVFWFVHLRTMSLEKYTRNNEIHYTEYFKRSPVTDSSQAAYERTMVIYDSLLKAKDIGGAALAVQKALIIRPGDSLNLARAKDLHKQMYDVTMRTGFLLRNIFATFIFPQLLMGLLVSFTATMIFRYRQQINQ